MGIFDKISNMNFQTGERKTHPIELFETLTHKIGYEYLREVQANFLKEWWEKKDQKDVVGIVNTGAGKTLMGLLMLHSKMNEGVGPVAYLCPDNHLVKQVIEQANLHGIPTVEISNGSQSTRQELPIEFVNSKSILVTTFEKVFNGLSIFGVLGAGTREIQELGALLIDDAHSSIKKIRKQSTFSIPSNNDMYTEILNLFSEDLEKQSHGSLHAIQKGESSVSRLIPYWSYHAKIKQVREILLKNNNDKNFTYFIPFHLIFDYLEKSNCYISGTGIEITPIQIPLEKIPSYFKAKHRFILSATFNNSADLITELGIEKEAVLNPINIQNESAIGERLILSPKRYSNEFDDNSMKKLLIYLAKENNVVILVSNREKAKEWQSEGALIGNKNTISEVISKLKTSNGNLVVLVNRYDGIDLLGDMCHLLVMDGLPKGRSVRDNAISQMRSDSPTTKKMIAQTIEQGLGRAVRSGSDYCVTLLLDNSLLNFVSNNKNRDYFSKIAKGQLDMGIELSTDFLSEKKSRKEASLEIVNTINLVLNRDKSWIKYYKNMLNLFIESYDNIDEFSFVPIAYSEYKVLEKFKNNKYDEAIEIIRNELVNNSQLSEEDKGWYFQMGGRILQSVDSVAANDMQVKAKDNNSSLLIPSMPLYSKKTRNTSKQSEQVKEWISAYTNGTDLKIAIDTILSNLMYIPSLDSNVFEEAVMKLGEFLGYESVRPEKDYNDGPDNLWISRDNSFVIECKNQSEDNRFSRDNIEQLLHSLVWYQGAYVKSPNAKGISFHKTEKLYPDSHSNDNIYSINSDNLDKLKKKVEAFSISLTRKSPIEWSTTEIEKLLRQYFLMDNQFVEHFSLNFTH